MTSLLQDFIRSEGIQAVREVGVHVAQGQQYKNLYSFKYNQMTVDWGHPISRECRGIILDSNDNWKIVAWPYDKFFNYNEPEADELVEEPIRAFEKLDGNLMILYFYDGKWQMASSNSVTADGEVSDGKNGMTYRKLFRSTWENLGYKYPKEKNFTFMFEVMTPESQIINIHDSYRIVLHGVRDTQLGRELRPEPFAEKYKWEVAQEYEFSTVQEAVKQADSFDGLKQEGIVLCDAQFNRIKIKGQDYLKYKYAKRGMKPVALMDMAIDGELDDILSVFPAKKQYCLRIQDKLKNIYSTVSSDFKLIEHLEGREFAEEAKKMKYSFLLFRAKHFGMETVPSYIKKMSYKSKKKLLSDLGVL